MTDDKKVDRFMEINWAIGYQELTKTTLELMTKIMDLETKLEDKELRLTLAAGIIARISEMSENFCRQDQVSLKKLGDEITEALESFQKEVNNKDAN